MSRSPVYILLIGLPGAGKSVLRNQLEELWEFPGFVVLSADDYVEARALRDGKTYNEMWESTVKEATAHLCASRKIAIDGGYSILQDQTNLTAKKRRGVLQQVPKPYFKVGITVTCPDEVRHQRLLSRPGKVIPAHVDRFMQDSYQPPTLDEGFHAIVPAALAGKLLQAHFSLAFRR